MIWRACWGRSDEKWQLTKAFRSLGLLIGFLFSFRCNLSWHEAALGAWGGKELARGLPEKNAGHRSKDAVVSSPVFPSRLWLRFASSKHPALLITSFFFSISGIISDKRQSPFSSTFYSCPLSRALLRASVEEDSSSKYGGSCSSNESPRRTTRHKTDHSRYGNDKDPTTKGPHSTTKQKENRPTKTIPFILCDKRARRHPTGRNQLNDDGANQQAGHEDTAMTTTLHGRQITQRTEGQQMMTTGEVCCSAYYYKLTVPSSTLLLIVFFWPTTLSVFRLFKPKTPQSSSETVNNYDRTMDQRGRGRRERRGVNNRPMTKGHGGRPTARKEGANGSFE
jgi:hypothetical protein